MPDPPKTKELCNTARIAARQVADIVDRLGELQELVDLTGVELPAATRRELQTELHESVFALHRLQLSVCEPRRTAPADQ